MPDFRTRGVTVIVWKEFEEEKCHEVETAAIRFFGPPLNLQNNNAFPCSASGLSPDEEIERFLRLKFEQRWIDLELEALKPNIVSHCLQAGGEVSHVLGTLKTRPYSSWQFSPAVDELQDRVTQLKWQEQENGVATKIERTVPYAILSRDVIASQIAIHLAPFLESEAEGDQAASFARTFKVPRVSGDCSENTVHGDFQDRAADQWFVDLGRRAHGLHAMRAPFRKPSLVRCRRDLPE